MDQSAEDRVREAGITCAPALEQSDRTIAPIARCELAARGIDVLSATPDDDPSLVAAEEAFEESWRAEQEADGHWTLFRNQGFEESDAWRRAQPLREPEWPEGHEPESTSIVVPAAYLPLFRREVAADREVHFGMVGTEYDADDDSARTVWALDRILSQLPTHPDDSGEAEVMVPVHRDCSARLLGWLREDMIGPAPRDRITEGLTSDDAKVRRQALAVVEGYASVIDQLYGLA